jgi:hypothetical protein
MIYFCTKKNLFSYFHRDKVARIVTIWKTKELISNDDGDRLHHALTQQPPPFEPMKPPFISPYPQNLPPPNPKPLVAGSAPQIQQQLQPQLSTAALGQQMFPGDFFFNL